MHFVLPYCPARLLVAVHRQPELRPQCIETLAAQTITGGTCYMIHRACYITTRAYVTPLPP